MFLALAAALCAACAIAARRGRPARRVAATLLAACLFAFIVVEHGVQLHEPLLISWAEHLLAPARPYTSPWPLAPAFAAARTAHGMSAVTLVDSVTYVLFVFAFAFLFAGALGPDDGGEGGSDDEDPPHPPQDPAGWDEFERRFWEEVSRQRDDAPAPA